MVRLRFDIESKKHEQDRSFEAKSSKDDEIL